MLLDRNKYNEEGYIGQEYISDSEKEKLHKFIIIEQSISENIFSLNEALQAYGVSEEEYNEYLKN